MQTKYPNNERDRNLPTLLMPTQGKASGLSYTAAISLTVLFSFVFSFILLAQGSTQEQLDALQKEDWYLYLSYLLPQLAFLLVTILYFLWTKRSPIEAAKAQNCHPKYFLVAFLLQIGLFSLSELNTLFLTFLERFGYVPSEVRLPSMEHAWGIVGVIFVVGVLPPVFEELFFRGILLKGLRSFGDVGAVLLCGGLFALYHQSPVQTVYQFCCGAAFALVAIKAGSILPTVLSHCFNNVLIIVLTACGVETIPLPVFIPVIIASVLCLVGSLVYLFVFDRKKEKKEEIPREERKAERIRFLVCVAVGVALCALNWIAALVTGFGVGV